MHFLVSVGLLWMDCFQECVLLSHFSFILNFGLLSMHPVHFLPLLYSPPFSFNMFSLFPALRLSLNICFTFLWCFYVKNWVRNYFPELRCLLNSHDPLRKQQCHLTVNRYASPGQPHTLWCWEDPQLYYISPQMLCMTLFHSLKQHTNKSSRQVLKKYNWILTN